MLDARNSLTRRAFLGMQACALIFLLTSCSAPEDDDSGADEMPKGPRSVPEIRASDYLHVGILTDVSPFDYLNSDGNYSGFDQYFCLFVAEYMSIGIKYIPIDPKDRYEVLKNYEVDMCIAQMSPQDEESEGVDYLGSLYELQLGLASPEDAPITSIDQIGQGELIVCRGTYAEQYAAQMWPEVTIKPYDTHTDACLAMMRGKGAAMLADEISAANWVKEKRGFVLSMTGIGEPRTIAPAIMPGHDDLREKLEEMVRTFYTYGYARKGYDTFIEPNVDGDYSSMLTPPQ